MSSRWASDFRVIKGSSAAFLADRMNAYADQGFEVHKVVTTSASVGDGAVVIIMERRYIRQDDEPDPTTDSHTAFNEK